jgi:erythromycin esterase
MHRIRFLTTLLVSLSCASTAVAAQTVRNLGFEEPAPGGARMPAGWWVGTSGYRALRDTAAVHGGSASLRMEYVPGATRFTTASQSVRVPSPRPRRVRIRGWIRTEGITRGYAGLWARVESDGEQPRTLAFDNMGGRGVTGTTPWAVYEIDLPLDSAVRVSLGVLHNGDGTAWFDDLEIAFDGKPLAPTRPEVLRTTPEQIEWLRANAHPLATDAPGSGLDDLARLAPLAAGARIIGLGEGTHGTREFFRAKHRLVEWLAEREGLTVFAIEANMPEARRVNEYVLFGRGSARSAVAGMNFWTWSTEEVVELVEWMRAYNRSGRGRLEFWGFDMQNPTLASDSLRAFLRRADRGLLPAADSAIERVSAVHRGQSRVDPAQARAALDAARRVGAHLAAQRATYLARMDTAQVDWAQQHARILEQIADRRVPGGASRDRSMAANVRWILEHQPRGTRMALWAHNGHVERAPGMMGAHLTQQYGAEYRVFGFAFGEGEYTAVGTRGLAAYPSEPAPAGTVEQALRATGLPRFVLDLRRASADPRGAWLSQPWPFRSIGALYTEAAFSDTPVAERFDALVYFDRTTPSRPYRYGPSSTGPGPRIGAPLPRTTTPRGGTLP